MKKLILILIMLFLVSCATTNSCKTGKCSPESIEEMFKKYENKN